MQLISSFLNRCGVIYIGLSVLCGIVYINMIKDSMSNDLFWPNMTPTGAQTYLLEAFSKHLLMGKKMDFDLFDRSSALVKKYDTLLASRTLWSSYPRSIVYSELTTVQDAIQGFRLFDATYAFSLFTQYCWVDFDRRWEIANTDQRQMRCYERYQMNGAVYLEAVLRNVDWDEWGSVNYPSFMQGVGNSLLESSQGRTWLAQVPNAFKSIDSEVKYWTDKGITNFVLQWNNRIQIGISESITIVNAFGSSQPLTTYQIAQTSRGPKWTTFGLYWAFFDDLWSTSAFNFSLVRNIVNNTRPLTMEAIYNVYPFTPASIVIHDTLGPFQSIDTFFVAPPKALIDTTSTFDSVMLVAMQSNATLMTDYRDLTTPTWDAVPKSWRTSNYQYYGGSPLCNARASTTFVQSSFSFDDVCGQPKPMQLAMSRESALFAYTRLRISGVSPIDSCGLCLTSTASCVTTIHQLEKIYNGIMSNATIRGVLSSTPTVNLSNVEIIQFAQLNTTSMVLRQQVLQSEWAMFGYVGVYEWVYGHREVISFEGDNNILTVLSEPLDSITFAASAAEIPSTTSQYLLALTVTTSVVLLAVAIATIAFFIRGRSDSSHQLYFFNRVAGPVWLGRPLMLLRSSTAIIVLSTSPIVFDTSMGFDRFNFEPRSIVYRLLLASEASWITEVTTDVLLLFTQHIARVQAPVSSFVFWVAILCLETLSPIRATAVVDRTCSRFNLDVDLTCLSGTVSIGSPSRVLLIVIINCLSVVAGYVIAKIYHRRNSKVAYSATMNMLPASALVFCPSCGTVWDVDASIACMSGLFRFQVAGMKYVLDTKLWIIFTQKELLPTISQDKLPSSQNAVTRDIESISRIQRIKKRLFLIVGLMYLVGTVAGSISYLQLADVNFSNDFWWANFNSTGTLTFIVNWYDKYRLFTPYVKNVQLDVPNFTDIADYSKENTVVSYSPLYASMVQFDVANDIAIAIHGLRQTDACNIPWIATQYCWLDFDRQYAMANSLHRQERCEKYRKNGAVYLEAPLRNLNWTRFESCWGDSFEIAIAKDLMGSSWLSKVKSNSMSEAEEVVYWKIYDITSYTVQWQNYKTIGLIDTFFIQNVFGFSYPINLQTTIGSMHLDQESSMKMYWSFARDLWAISTNGSGIHGFSLLRDSSRFAYQNTTPLAVYLTNNTLSPPLGRALTLFSAEVGPFGSVDILHIPPPKSLLTLTQQIEESLGTVLSTNELDSQNAFRSLPMVASMMPVPMVLKPHLISGGSFLCDEIAVPVQASYGMLLFFAPDASCSLSLGEILFPNARQVLFASVASALSIEQIPLACSSDTVSVPNCITLFQSAFNFTTTYLPTAPFSVLKHQVVTDVSMVEIMQYIVNTTTSSHQLFHQRLLENSDPSMILFGWMYLYDWAMGVREVVQVNGDHKAMSIISSFSTPTTFTVDAMEVPRSFSAYCKALCLYITFVLAVIAIVAGVYTLFNRFTTEGSNMLEANRVSGLVWIGRPLLLVRSLTALAILSTATLELQALGSVTVMISTRSDQSTFMILITKLLAAGEVSWLMYILQDLTMVFTREMTAVCAPISGILIWLLSFSLSVAAPVTHLVTIDRQCSVDTIDYQVVCSTGTLVIGSVVRFLTLIISSFAISGIVYLVYRWRYPFVRHNELPSSLLSCGAKYLFDRSEWVHSEVYFIDYASAALTGLLTFPCGRKVFVFDVKIWRIVVLERDEFLGTKRVHQNHLKKALPLVQ